MAMGCWLRLRYGFLVFFLGDKNMYNRGLFIKGLLIVSVAGLLCVYAFAAQPSGQADPNKPSSGDQATTSQPSAGTAGQTGAQPQPGATAQGTSPSRTGMAGQTGQQSTQLVKSSDLIGKKLKSSQGSSDLGTIHDLVLTADYQQVSYAALSRGGTLGIGSKLYAVPWSAIKATPDGTATANITAQTLDQAKSFDNDNWPSQGDMTLSSASGTASTTGMSSSSPTAGSSTSSTGTTGTSASDQSAAGTSSSTGQSAQASRSRSSTASTDASQDPNRTSTRDRGRNTTVQRAETDQMASTTGSAATGANADVQNRRVSKLTGTSVKNPKNEDIGDVEDFVIDAPNGHVAYTVVSFGGFWGIGEKYAAIPATAVDFQSQPGVAAINADRQALESVAFDPGKWPDLTSREYSQRLREVFKEEPYRATLGYVSPSQPKANSQQAWSAQGDYAKNFDASHITTIKGTVQSVGTFEPAKGVAEGLRLRVKTSDGKTVTVHAGPVQFARQQNFDIKPGDEVTITGSNAKIGWRSAFVASEIQKGDQTLRLRSKTGEPLWSMQGQQSTGQQSRQGSSSSTSGQSGQTGQSGQQRTRTTQ